MAPEIKALTVLKERVLVAPPIALTPSSLDCWIVFTDGAVEGECDKHGSVGGVLFVRMGGVFRAEVPDHVMSRLCKSSANPIYELEVLPAVLAASLWGSRLRGSQCVFYLDNDAARAAFIKGHASTLESSIFMDQFVDLELNLQLKCWFSRVPSYSNIADDPSRSKFDTVLSLGAEQADIAWSWVCEALDA